MAKKVGIWMYQNGGGTAIQEKLVNKLKTKGIESVTGLDLKYAVASKNGIIVNNQNILETDMFFSYNAGEQTVSQLYFYEHVSRFIPTLNNYQSFALSEDKFKTNSLLAMNGVKTSDFFIAHRDKPEEIFDIFDKWGKLVFKPLDGWGGVGMALIENKYTLETLMPFLNQMDMRHFYIEKFIQNDKTDFRIDVVDGEFVGGYSRVAGNNDWRTNITSGGHVEIRPIPDEVIEIAIKASKIVGLEISGVDLIYDQESKEYIVLEVNGIPAFATPDQEKMGLNFNDKKIDKIVKIIENSI
jgi:ribosomal protein S6--L-glutamate ligase